MVNDCAYVGETLIKYSPADVKFLHLKRSRGFWDKTVRVAWRIFRSRGDLFHVHYLLQDCYLSLKLEKRPLVGHAHGSDLRHGLKHKVWGKIVRYNLKHCDKVLVSTPDILESARKYRKDVEYVPNPVDTRLFYPKPVSRHNGRLKVLVAASCNWKAKGTDVVVRALSMIKEKIDASVIRYGKDFARTMALAESLDLHFNVLPKTSHQNIRKYYWNADVVIGSLGAGSLGMVSLEAIACGRPVITYVSSKYSQYESFPLKDINTVDKVVEAIESMSSELWKLEYDYLSKHHKPEKVVKRMIKIWRKDV